jgi:hypothetical protein
VHRSEVKVMAEKKGKLLGRWVARLAAGTPKEPPPGALCRHAGSLKKVAPQTEGCAECLQTGQTWVYLRICLLCGHVGCDDSSRGKHATAHFQTTRHPLVRTLEEGESWGWCYYDQQELDGRYLPPLR